MTLEELMPHTEALIFASERPITLMELTDYLSQALEEAQAGEMVAACIDAIREKYDAGYYPFSLRESGGGFQFLTKKEYHKTVLQLNGDKHIRKLSTAAMETLSIIAYKQPVTKSEIEVIRGVSADYAIQKLLEKELIVITGRNEDAVGKPLVYATSKTFMDYLGVNSPADLPALKEIINMEVVIPTEASEAQPEEAGSTLVVTETGELLEDVPTDMTPEIAAGLTEGPDGQEESPSTSDAEPAPGDEPSSEGDEPDPDTERQA